MDITHHYTQIHDHKVHYLTSGSAERDIILLHGGGLDTASLSWGLLMPQLAARGCRVIAPDWPGFGESEAWPEGVSIATLQKFLAAFLAHLGIQQAGLAGISMGGGTALGFALENPARVERLVLVDSYGLQRSAAMHRLSYLFVRFPGVRQLTWVSMRSKAMVRYALGALLKRPGSVTETLVDELYQGMLRPGATKAFSEFQDSELTWEGLRTCYADRLAELTMPVLIIHGTRDGLVPVENARKAHAAIAHSRLEWMEGSGHWPQRDDPLRFNQVVVDFFAQQ